MLTCSDVTERANGLIDRELALGSLLAVRFHLLICSLCRAYLDQMRKTRRLLAGRALDPLDAAAEEALIALVGRPNGGEPAS